MGTSKTDVVRRLACMAGMVSMCFGAGFLSTSSAALAQSAPDSSGLAPRVAITNDSQVDLITGTFIDSTGSISIGDSQSPSLSYAMSGKQQNFPMKGEVSFYCVAGSYSACQSNYYAFVLGDKLEFSSIPPALTDGSFFSSTSTGYTVYDNSGNQWIFATVAHTGSASGVSGRLSEIRRLDGSRLVYSYASATPAAGQIPTSIKSSDGFQLNLNGLMYGGSSIVNWGRNYLLTNRRFFNCTQTSGTCPSADADWPAVNTENLNPGTRSWSTGNGKFTTTSGVDSDGHGWLRVTTPSGDYRQVYTEESTKCSPFDGGSPELQYTTSDKVVHSGCYRVSKVKTPSGDWTYAYNADMTLVQSTSPSLAVTKATVALGSVQITDPNGAVTKYSYAGGQFRSGTSYYKYLPSSLSGIVFPDGNSEVYSYIRGHLSGIVKKSKPGSGLSDLTWSASYPASCSISNYAICNKPDYVIDFRGGRTDYTYDPVHGGVLTEVSPADAIGRRATKRYEYSQFSATYMDANGTMSSGEAIWKLFKVHVCATNEACAGSAEETVTTYDYNENLLVRGIAVTANGQTLRTCYSYDRVGNRISETKPRANLASCS